MARKNPSAAHWRVKFRPQIAEIQKRHASNITALANKAGITTFTARRYIERTFVQHRRQNSWNMFLAWLKHHADSSWAPKEGQTQQDAYNALTAAARRDIREWWDKKRIDLRKDTNDTNPKEVIKVYNQQCRRLTEHVRHLALRYGIIVAALVSHPHPGIRPYLAAGKQGSVVLAGTAAAICEGKTTDDLSYKFDGGVKGEIWKNPVLTGVMGPEGPDPLPPTTPKTPTQILADAFIRHVHPMVSSAAEAKGGDLPGRWNRFSSTGTRLRFKGFFSLVAEAGCFIDGWPTAAITMIVKEPESTDLPATGPVPPSFAVFRGSLQNTSAWRVPAMDALKEAIESGSLVVRTAEPSDGNGGDGPHGNVPGGDGFDEDFGADDM
ncbi:hypothetical protein OC844_006415 [Tilletia horrida]|nr:hypothetical protein OC844_006415 [Tilletia horrida]